MNTQSSYREHRRQPGGERDGTSASPVVVVVRGRNRCVSYVRKIEIDAEGRPRSDGPPRQGARFTAQGAFSMSLDISHAEMLANGPARRDEQAVCQQRLSKRVSSAIIRPEAIRSSPGPGAIREPAKCPSRRDRSGLGIVGRPPQCAADDALNIRGHPDRGANGFSLIGSTFDGNMIAARYDRLWLLQS